MKKIFYFIASAIVALGAVACQNDIEENIENNQQTEGLSFTATIDDITRVVVGNSDIAGYDKKLSWEGNETIVVSDSDFTNSFEFKNTEATPNIFTCTEDGVNVLVGKTVLLQHGDDSSATFYDAHAEGPANSMYLTSDNIDNFATEEMGEIKMYAGQQLFRLECYEEVTLKMYTEWEDLGSIFFYDWKNGDDPKEEVVFAAGEHYFTANAAYDVTIEAYINGVKVKETSGKDLYNTSVIYNLGTIAVPNVLYLNPGIWREAEDAWFAAYFFNKKADAVAAMTRAEAEGTKWVKMTDEDVDGIYECEAPAGYNSVIFTRMDLAKEEFGFENAKNQTADLAVPAAGDANNTYAVTGWDNQEQNKPTEGNWGSKPAAAQWGLISSADNWVNDIVMESVDLGVFAAKNVVIKDSDEFKVRRDKTWESESYGAGEVNTIEPGHYVASVLGGMDNNFKVSVTGTYDVYFDYATKRVYVVTPGADYTTATEQTANPSTATVPGQPSEWALVGVFSGWADKSFVTTTTSNIVVLKGVTMKAAEGFLVRKPSTDWADKYGAGSINYLKANHFITTSKEGADMCLEKDGTYDIYFDINAKRIYIMTAGTDYNTATEQTVNGEEPENEEIEVVDGNVLYLIPSKNWKESNARFAVYTWDGGDQWFSMNKVADGVYKVAVPKNVSNIIFCRMNPNTTANNWNNKWNQTSDLKVQSNGNNCYTVKEGTWDKGGGSWSKYTE